jgi:hypothetical protein
MDELYEAFYENKAIVTLAAICFLIIAYLGVRQLANWWAGWRILRRRHRSARHSGSATRRRRSRHQREPTDGR